MHTSHLYREIHQQPAVLAALLADGQTATAQLAAAIRARGITHIVIAARGTSDNAARYAQYLLASHNQMLVTLATPSLFSLYHQPPQLGNVCVLGISQSGRSPDIVAVLEEARRQGALTAAITNVGTSPLATAADHVISLGAGEEHAVAATKTYTAQLGAIALLSVLLAQNAEAAAALNAVPDAMTATLELQPTIEAAVERYRYMQHCVVIGRGYNYATAFELALKLKELTYTHVEPYSSADFLHGPLALIETGFPLLVVAPSGVLEDELDAFCTTVRERGAELIVVSDAERLLRHARTPLRLPHVVPEWLSPLTAIIPGQLFALHLAHTRGYNIDQPRGIRKVTETV